MTREEVIQTIKDTIRMNGFIPETDERFSTLPFVKEDGTDYINISILERLDFENSDFENKIAGFRIEINFSIRKMGGHPTPEELLRAADQIRRGAELTKNLQEMNLFYRVQN